MFGEDRQAAPRPDYARIAVLEYELLYVIPEPDTVAALAVGLAIFSGQIKAHKQCGQCDRAFRRGAHWCPECSDCPEHGFACSRPLPGDDYDCPNGVRARAEAERWEEYHREQRRTGYRNRLKA